MTPRLLTAAALLLLVLLGAIKQGEHLKLLVLRSGKSIALDIVAGPDQ